MRFDEVHDASGQTRPHWRRVERDLLKADRATLLRAQDRRRGVCQDFAHLTIACIRYRLVAPPHVTVAWGRDYSDVAPLKGVVFTHGGHRLSVTVTVTRT